VGSLGLVITWGGYVMMVYGYVKMKSAYTGAGLSISDIVLPSHRATYIAAMLANQAVGVSGTTGIAGGTAEAQNALAQAKANAKDACAKFGANSYACKSAQQLVTQAQNELTGTGKNLS